jgi:hypothetical protein
MDSTLARQVSKLSQKLNALQVHAHRNCHAAPTHP